MKYLVLLLAITVGAGGGVWIATKSAGTTPGDSIQITDTEAALQAFQEHVRLINAYDPAFADSYARSAIIHMRFHHTSGGVEAGSLSAAEFKAKADMLLNAGRQAGDQYHFSNLHASRRMHGVRIEGRRSTSLSRQSYPYTVDMMEVAGAWKIVEEWSEGGVP